MKSITHALETSFESSTFKLNNLIVESSLLKGNPLQDSPRKHNYVLAPRSQKSPLPLVVHLSGYFGNGTQSFNIKTMEAHLPVLISEATEQKKIPLAIHVFVDAMTSLGGCQFINSDVCGPYSDYIQQELVPAIDQHFNVTQNIKQRCFIGTSSGGYGALHHLSLKNSTFGVALVSAPDSDFEKSLLPDLYKTAPYLSELNTLKKIKMALKSGELKKKKNFFDIMNTLAMSCCYGSFKKDQIQFPIHLQTGELLNDVWKEWQSKDPIFFLGQRAQNLKGKVIYLEVGTFDEFSLYFGARQIKTVLEKTKCKVHYQEFPGGHFGSTERKLVLLGHLKNLWR